MTRYLVFEQPKEGKPFQLAGSVHVPDPELALQNARDVFSRRPGQVNLWVAPADFLFSKTKEELENYRELSPKNDDELKVYRVFQKNQQRGVHTYVGEINARSPELALHAALDGFANERTLVWWLIPDHSFTETDPAEGESLFTPAESKPFRHATDFKVVTLMRELKNRSD